MIKEFLKEIVNYILVFIMWVCFVLGLYGCSNTVKEFKEPGFNVGCYASNVDAKLGYFNQEGSGEACKAKCSKDLPPNFCWEYHNQKVGCNIKVGNCGQ